MADSNALTQNAQGRWDLTLKHDKSGVNLQIPARLTYDGSQVTATITNTAQTFNTDWYTELGVPINPDDIDKYAQPVTKDGKTYVVTAWTFTVEPYDESGTTAETIYSVEVLPETASIAPNGHVSLTSYYVGKQGDTEVSRINVTNVATWTSNNNYVIVNGGSVSGNNTSSSTTRSSRVTAAYSGKSAYCDITVGKASGSTVTYQLVVNPASLTIPYNGSEQLTAKFYTITDGHPDEGVDVTRNPNCRWTSSDSSHASVSSDGIVSGHNDSSVTQDVTARITATYNQTSGACQVTVTKSGGETGVTTYELSISATPSSIAWNGSSWLTAEYVTLVDGRETSRVPVSPENVTWEITKNPGYGTINATTGEFVANNQSLSGTNREIKIKGTYAGTLSNEVAIQVSKRPPEETTHELKVEPKTGSIGSADTMDIQAWFYTYEAGSLEPTEILNVTEFADCTWTSNKYDVATVSAGHVVSDNQTYAEQNVLITASYCGYTDNSQITVAAKGGDFEFNIDIDPEFLYDDHTIVIKYFVNEEEHGDFTRPVIRVNSNAEWTYQTTMNRPPEANPLLWFITTKTPTGEDYNAVINFTTVQFDVNKLSNRNGKIEFYSGPNVEEGELLASFDVVEASHIWVDPDNLAYDRVGETKQVTIEGYGFYDVEENADWFSVTGDVVGEDYGQFRNHIDVTVEDNETQFSREDRVIVKPKYNDDIEIAVRQTTSMFSVSPSEYTFDSTGETVELNIQTQQYWLAVIDSGCEGWVSLDRNSGTTTNTKLNVTVSDNTGGSVRGCLVKFYDYHDQTRQLGSFRINQSEGDSITLNPETIIGIGSAGDVRTINVTANGSWEILPDIEIITPTGIIFEPDVTFDKTSGNGNDTVTVTIGPNTIDVEIRLGIKFRRGSAEATLSLWQQTAPAPDLNIYDANGVQLFDNSEVVIDSEGGIIPFKVVCNNNWSATIDAYEADGTTYFAYPEGLPSHQTFSGPSGETISNIEVRRTESAEDRNGTITFRSYYGGSGRKEVTIRLKRTGVSDFVPYAVSDVYIRMEDVDGDTMTKQGPFTDTDFGDLEGDIKNMYIEAYLSGNGASADGVIVDFGVWDINNVAGHDISSCNWSNVTQVNSHTCTNASGEEQVNINLGPLSFFNKAGQQSMAIALRVTVGGTSYYAKLDEESTVPSERGFILFTDSFYAIYI